MHDPDTRPVQLRDYATREYDKEVVKEALKEWLDEKLLTFGKWSLGSLGAAVLVLIVYMILTTHGWKAPV